MKKLFIVIMLQILGSVLYADMPIINQSDISMVEAQLPEAIRLGSAGAGKKFCGTALSSSGIRLFIHSTGRIALIYPFVGNVEKGREASGLVIQSQTMKMKPEVQQALLMNGVSGKVADETVVYQINQRESYGINTTYAVMAFYLDEKGYLDKVNSILLLTDKQSGTFFVGTTKACSN